MNISRYFPKAYKNKTWSQVCCSVPLHKGLRIAQLCRTSNAESPTSMILSASHHGCAPWRGMKTFIPKGRSRCLVFDRVVKRLRSSYAVKTKAFRKRLFLYVSFPTLCLCFPTNGSRLRRGVWLIDFKHHVFKYLLFHNAKIHKFYETNYIFVSKFSIFFFHIARIGNMPTKDWQIT